MVSSIHAKQLFTETVYLFYYPKVKAFRVRNYLGNYPKI